MARRDPNPNRVHSPQKRLIDKLERNSEELYALLNKIIQAKPNTPTEKAIQSNSKHTKQHFDALILRIKDSDLDDLDGMIDRVLES